MLLRCLLFVALASALHAAPPPAVWDAPATLTSADLPAALAKVDQAAAPLPAALTPAVSFQRLLLKIRAGAPVDDWRPEIAKFAAGADSAPVAAGLRDLAKAWEARARMEDVDAALHKFYARNVRFPAKLGEASLPESAQTDPWGDAWSYTLGAPKGFSAKFASQRYRLAPGKHPQVRPLAETLAEPEPARPWAVTAREVARQKVLEFRSGNAVLAATQAGGHVDDATVLYVGDRWALLADLEHLFTVTF